MIMQDRSTSCTIYRTISVMIKLGYDRFYLFILMCNGNGTEKK